MEVSISVINAQSPQYNDVWQLREEVLRKPLGLSLKNEDLGMDAGDTIFIATHNNKVIGCLMLHPLGKEVIKFRQMAVYDTWQGSGIGRMLMEAAEIYAAKNHYIKISLHARKIVSGFYLRLGFSTIGDEFTEVGIVHLLMEKEI